MTTAHSYPQLSSKSSADSALLNFWNFAIVVPSRQYRRLLPHSVVDVQLRTSPRSVPCPRHGIRYVAKESNTEVTLTYTGNTSVDPRQSRCDYTKIRWHSSTHGKHHGCGLEQALSPCHERSGHRSMQECSKHKHRRESTSTGTCTQLHQGVLHNFKVERCIRGVHGTRA
jgi:hypothetical protein